ncbi:MAG: DJ-1/PfpI family protein [Bacteroidales bacterium]|nr:DJ-1/PfpI family protein [Bacteroidales bacterium]
MKKAYIILAEGFELIEAMAPVDVFRRGGIDVKTVSLDEESLFVTSSNHTTIAADLLWSDADFTDADLIYLPGGYPGYENLGNSPKVGAVAKQQYESGKMLAAICGAPTVLLKNSIAFGKTVTSHSCCADEMSAKYQYTGKPYEHDGNLWTAIGAGHSQDFAIALAQELAGDAAVAKIKKGMELKF